VNNPLERLKQIADEIRNLPYVFRILPDAGALSGPDWDGETTDWQSLCPEGGRLLSEAIDLDAFAGAEYSEIRILRMFLMRNHPGDWESRFFSLAINRLTPTLIDAELRSEPSSATMGECCDSIADALEAEIRRMEAVPPPAKAEQDEGGGGTGSAPEQPAVTSDADRAAILAKLQPAKRKAYFSFVHAEGKAGKRLEDYEAYEWLKENGIDTDKGDTGELADYELPVFDTWSRQLRKAREPLREQKYTRRAGRATGRSIVSGREIEYQNPETH